MKALFFIEIPAQHYREDLSFNWYKKTLDNESSGCNTLPEIKNNCLDCDVILIVPGFFVTQKQIQSKIRNRKKLEVAIAYELEEQLSEEIDALFFAYQPTKEKHTLDVAIINRSWFEHWLEVFKQQEISLMAVISDTMLLKSLTQDYLLIQRKDDCLLKTPTEIYTVDNENLGYFLTKLKNDLPEELAVISETSQNVTLDKLTIQLKTIPVQYSLLKLLTENYQVSVGVNLLQGEYKPKLKNDWQKIQWAAIGLFSVLMMATCFQGYQHWQLTKQETKLDQQREKVFKDNFPDVTRIVNPLAQMKHKLEVLQQNQQQQGQFMVLLAKVSHVLREMIAQDKIQLQGLEFDNDTLLVKLNADSLEMINQIKQSLAQQQLNVEIASSDKVENKFNASFKVLGNKP